MPIDTAPADSRGHSNQFAQPVRAEPNDMTARPIAAESPKDESVITIRITTEGSARTAARWERLW